MATSKLRNPFGSTDELDPNLIAPGEINPNSPDLSGAPKPVPTPPAGAFNLEGIRGRLGFGKTQLTDPQAWLNQNQDVAMGASIKGDKLYDPSGKYLADVIGNSKSGGTTSQFLDGIDSSGQKRPSGSAKGSAKSLGANPAGQAAGLSSSISESIKPSFAEIMSQLQGLFPGGMYNDEIVDRRTNSAADRFHSGMQSRMATNKAILADRGLLGQGPEITAQNRATEDLYDQYLGSVNEAHADESSRADDRMMKALQLAAGLTEAEASMIIDAFRAQSSDRLGQGRLNLDTELGRGELALGNRNSGITQMLGLGNLALGNLRANNDYSLGSGRLDLDADLGFGELDDKYLGRLLEWLEQNNIAQRTKNDGFIG